MPKLKRYEKYKDSGIEWIGEVPKHWKVIKIRRLSRVKRGASPRPIDDPKYFDENGVYSWVRIADITRAKKYLTQTEQKVSKLGEKNSVRISPDTLFISICATVGKPCLSKIYCCLHDGFVFFPDLSQEETHFIFYLFESEQPYKGLGKLGTQLNLNTEIMGSIFLPLPNNYKEMKLITTFIDKKTSEIDSLIADKEKLVEKLQEYKQSLITKTVTKGLDPNVKMKDSGIEWIGEVPEHWGLIPLKWYIKLSNGEFLDNYSKSNENEDIIPVIGGNGFIGHTRKAIINKSTIVIGRVGALCGNVHYVNYNAWVTDNALYVSKYKHKYLSLKYLFWVLKCRNLNQLADRTAQPLLNGKTIRKEIITLPPMDEQGQINEYIKEKEIFINYLIVKINNQIQKLKEYRQSLITHAVTGKIDVRDYFEEGFHDVGSQRKNAGRVH